MARCSEWAGLRAVTLWTWLSELQPLLFVLGKWGAGQGLQVWGGMGDFGAFLILFHCLVSPEARPTNPGCLLVILTSQKMVDESPIPG